MLGKRPASCTQQDMFSASQLTEDQKQALKEAAANGSSLADLQRLLKEQFSTSVTYMDMRFIILDLGIELAEERPVAADAEDSPPPANDEPAPPAAGTVSVTMDAITLPGTLVSGKVAFSDGETGIWMIDQSGRPGLDPDTPGYRPSQEDLIDFQDQLRGILQSGRI